MNQFNSSVSTPKLHNTEFLLHLKYVSNFFLYLNLTLLCLVTKPMNINFNSTSVSSIALEGSNLNDEAIARLDGIAWLTKVGMDRYIPNCVNAGYTSLLSLKDLTDQDLEFMEKSGKL